MPADDLAPNIAKSSVSRVLSFNSVFYDIDAAFVDSELSFLPDDTIQNIHSDLAKSRRTSSVSTRGLISVAIFNLFLHHNGDDIPGNKHIKFNSLRPSDAYICVNKITIIGSDNGLSPGRRQAII